MPAISIFIPTKNAGLNFKKTLESIFSQSEKNIEVVIVDSGSQDETLKIAEQFPVKIHQIDPSEFGHGKTRNLALKYTQGSLIVFLTQDVIPFNDSWLALLISECRDSKTAGAFSRQIPYPETSFFEKQFYAQNFPDKRIVRDLNKDEPVRMAKTFFSNAAACIRRDVLEKFLFNEHIMICEDQEFSKKILKAGYKTIQCKDSIVWHSHDYGFVDTFRRYFDTAYSMKQFLDYPLYDFFVTGMLYLKREYAGMPMNLVHLFSSVKLNTAKIMGTSFAMISSVMPKKLNQAFSMHKYYWAKKNIHE